MGIALSGSLNLTGSLVTTGSLAVNGAGSFTGNLTLNAYGNQLKIGSNGGTDGFIGIGSTQSTMFIGDYSSGTKGLTINTATGSATFSNSVSIGGYLTGTGVNPGGLGGSRYLIDFSGNYSRFFSYGINNATNGAFLFNSQRSDGTNSIDFLSIASTGAATFSSSVTATNSSTGFAINARSNWSAIPDNPIITFGRAGSAVAGAIGYDDSLGSLYIGTTTAHPFLIKYNSTTVATFTTSGNVQLSPSNSGNSVSTGNLTLISSATAINDRLTISFSQDGIVGRARAGIGAVAELANGYASSLAFYTRNAQDGSSLATTDERMRITSDGYLRMAAGGIQFNGDTADANSLDDYEEGTWTPTFTASTSGTITVNSGNTVGRYTKIGRQVTVNGSFYVTSVSSPVGEWRIQGLPFTSAAGSGARSAVSVIADGLETTATTSVVGYVDSSVTYITLYKYAAGALSTMAADVKASSYVFLTATYFV